ncbi:MAG TPA: DUF885 family protein, partial [Candidatus Eremiobacteraceae bacterium]|nr:DUF885 family protein [Candidatus Eremiobacteraceae bacterium]
MEHFSKTSRAIVDDILKHDPIGATWAGVHDYDAQIPDVSLQGFADDQTRAKKHLTTLRAWDVAQLPPHEQIDWNLLVSKFEVDLRELAELEPQRHEPSLYPDTAISAIYSLLARDYAPLAERLPALESRLQKLPQIFAAGKTNLERSPKIWTEIAIEETEGGAEFLRHTVGPIAQQHPALQPSLAKALAASADYAEFLRSRQLQRDGM